MNHKEFLTRRRQLMREMGDNTIAIIQAAPERVRNRDVTYPYRQDSDFLYVSNFPEPEAVIVLVPNRAQGEYILFCREKDYEKETWHGKRFGQAGAVELFDADDSFPIDDLDDILPGLLENKAKVFYTMGRYADFDKRMIDWVAQLKSAAKADVFIPNDFVPLEHILHEARLYKSSVEVAKMRKAANISAAAHIRAMRACEPGMMEFQLDAELVYEFNKNGATFAYPCIVGGGANGCILHYTENDTRLNDGDLVLIDAGAEYSGYASDVSRTFPVNGTFTPIQRELYELVLESQFAAIAATKPGNHWNDPHDCAVDVLTKGLINIGLLKGDLATLKKESAYKRFYMHRTGHWLGLDVHDVGDYKLNEKWRLLEPGMVMTVEPGLYINAEKDVPKEFRNIGIRIEDDVLVTKQGNEVLSEAAPKTVEAIERVMSSA